MEVSGDGNQGHPGVSRARLPPRFKKSDHPSVVVKIKKNQAGPFFVRSKKKSHYSAPNLHLLRLEYNETAAAGLLSSSASPGPSTLIEL